MVNRWLRNLILFAVGVAGGGLLGWWAFVVYWK